VLVRAMLSRRDDHTLLKRAAIKGFEILSHRRPAAPVPDLFVRGAETYSAHLANRVLKIHYRRRLRSCSL